MQILLKCALSAKLGLYCNLMLYSHIAFWIMERTICWLPEFCVGFLIDMILIRMNMMPHILKNVAENGEYEIQALDLLF